MSQTLVQLTRVNLDDFGVYPGSVNMVSTANLATITTAGYLNNNGYEFFNVNLMPTDIIQCLYSYNQITGVGSYAVFSVDIDDDGIFTLVDQSPSGAYLPLDGGVMTGGIQTAGETISNSALTTLRSTFIYLGVGADTPISPVASNFLYETVTHPVNIYDPSGLADYDEGFFFAIKNVSGGNVTFTPFGSEKIDGASSLTIPNQSSVIIAKTSTQWSTVAESNFVTGVTSTQVQQSAFNAAADSGILNQYDLVLSPAVTSYTDQLPVYFTPANTNTSTTPTMQVNALAAHTIVKAGQAALVAGDIVAGTPCMLLYSTTHTNWLLLNPQSSSASPWVAGAGTGSAKGGDGTAIASGSYSVSYGSTSNKAAGTNSVAFGDGNAINGSYCFGAGQSNTQGGNYSVVFGGGNTANANWTFTCGLNNQNNGGFGFVCGANNELDSSSGSFIGGGHCRNTGYDYTFMWGDNVGTTNYPTAAGQFIVNASGGFFIWNANASLTAKFLSTGCTLIGTNTNNNASAGYVGEFISSRVASASAISLTTMTASNVTSISLTAGDWDIEGNVSFAFGGVSTGAAAWISLTSATLPDYSLYNAIENSGGIGSVGFSTPKVRVSIASTTTVYLSAQPAFSTSTATACGGIYARRVR